MKRDQIWQIRYQMNGCYMPDNMVLVSSKRQAIAIARADALEYADVVRENTGDSVYFFVREEWQEWSREHDSYPYMIVVEPVSWRAIAYDIGVKTRQEVLEHEYA